MVELKLILQRPTFLLNSTSNDTGKSEIMFNYIGSGSLMIETKGTSSNPDFKIVDKDNQRWWIHCFTKFKR